MPLYLNNMVFFLLFFLLLKSLVDKNVLGEGKSHLVPPPEESWKISLNNGCI